MFRVVCLSSSARARVFCPLSQFWPKLEITCSLQFHCCCCTYYFFFFFLFLFFFFPFVDVLLLFEVFLLIVQQKGNDSCFQRKVYFDLTFTVCCQPLFLTKRSRNKGHLVISLLTNRVVLTLKNSKREFNIVNRVAQLQKKRHLEVFIVFC